jgi:sugar (pentulose or hexulose) kinase
MEAMTEWFTDQLKTFAKKYAIRALSVTTHGATVMCLDKRGALAVPPVAYTTEADEAFRKEFYDTFGSPEELQRTTATAEVGSLINPGKLLFFVKKKYPEEFAKVNMILNYPQYWGFVFTGKYGAEPTYTGCHTYLFDFEKKVYSKVAHGLGIADKLPPKVAKSWEVLGTVSAQFARTTGLPADCIVTMGIHDSNSSLLPYLVKGHREFVLNSTGTWCVAMHPSKRVHFEPSDIGKLVFFNLSAFGKPVKTSIFMGGLEFDKYCGLLKTINGRGDYPPFKGDLYRKVIAEKNLFILPSVVKGTGIFPDAKPRAIENGVEFPLAGMQDAKRIPGFFRDYETAHAVLAASLAIQTRCALDIAGFTGEGAIFTEGGFRKNDRYNKLLAALYPKADLALTKLEEATAFGAAMLAKAALDTTTPEATRNCFEIERIDVVREPVEGMAAYAQRFMELV